MYINIISNRLMTESWYAFQTAKEMPPTAQSGSDLGQGTAIGHFLTLPSLFSLFPFSFLFSYPLSFLFLSSPSLFCLLFSPFLPLPLEVGPLTSS